MSDNKKFLLRGRKELKRIEESVSSLLKIQKSSGIRRELVYYDTFDWLFYSKGCHLIKIDSVLKLYDFRNNTLIAETDEIPSGDWFYSNVFSGIFAEIISKISTVRAIR